MLAEGVDDRRMSNFERAIAYLRQNGVSQAIEALVNFIRPYVIYTAGEPHLGVVNALIGSSAPPLAWIMQEVCPASSGGRCADAGTGRHRTVAAGLLR